MSKFASTLAAFPPALTVLLCLAATPAPAQSFTFTSDGTGPYFTDKMTTGRPHPVDFFSKTSGQSADKASILTITGYGNSGIVYTNNGLFTHENADLTTASVLLQDAASGAPLFAFVGPIHYEFITSPYRIDTLTLSGTVFDAAGIPQTFDFFKDEDGGTATAHIIPAPVPELAPSVGLAMMLGLTLAGVIEIGRKRHKSVQED